MRIRLITATCIFLQLGFIAPSSALSREEVKKAIALTINLEGYLCAKVTSVQPLSLKDTYEVQCIEYGGGSRTVDYIYAIRNGQVIVEK